MAFPTTAEISAVPRKLLRVNWGLVVVTCLIAGIGTAMLYSAGHGSWRPWAGPHLLRFGMILAIMLAVAVIDIRFWWRYAYAIYAIMLALLAAVDVFGTLGMGAQRWIDLGLFRLQPSELIKIGLVLALARYFHRMPIERVRRWTSLIVPALLTALPMVLALRQPDLGTALSLALIALAVLFVIGVSLWVFVGLAVVAGAALPVIWSLVLKPYQKQRVWSFLDPESDPLGAGYHILQSKIALGSGGLHGKGFMQGSQSQLSFLPEIHTDFIFTMLAEEFGMVGGLVMIFLFFLIFIYAIVIALQSRNHFGRILTLGVAITLFMYISVNIAMVTGLVPVVGVPLPLVSYGGTAMLTIMFGIGLMICTRVHWDVEDINMRSGGD